MRKGEAELVPIIVGPCPGPLLGLCDSVLLLPLCPHGTSLGGTPRAPAVGGASAQRQRVLPRQLGLLTPTAQEAGSGPRMGVPMLC